MSTRVEPLLTIADLDAMPDDGNRYEIIEGELFVSCAPNLIHQTVALNLAFAIRMYLLENPIGAVWMTPGVIFSELNGVIPDLVFVGKERAPLIASGERITGVPDLVVEIASSGAENQRRDRVVKRHLYAKHGVKEYWIADPATRSIEVYALSGQRLRLLAEYKEGDSLVSSVLPGFSCEIESVFQ